MFGCPCYRANKKLFAFLVDDGVVITLLSDGDRKRISSSQPTGFFRAGKKVVRTWVRADVNVVSDLKGVMPFVRKSYQAALRKV